MIKRMTEIRVIQHLVFWFLFSAILINSGCNPPASTPQELANFENIVIQKQLVKTEFDAEEFKCVKGVYRVVVGDVIELHMPTVLTTANPKDPGRTEPHFCRVEPDGTICLPIIGKIKVVGKTLSEIEAVVVDAFYPKHVVSRPAVVAKVNEYYSETIAIWGAVNKPGNYSLSSNEMSLSDILNKAEGVVSEGAGAIRVKRIGRDNKNDPIIIPVRNLNTPFVDLALVAGDSVEVIPIDENVFSVVGMVNKPGVFPYPVGLRYNLIEAIASACGVNAISDPRYAHIYRSLPDGEVAVVVVKIDQNSFADAAKVSIHPGDVVLVEQTTRTVTRRMLAEMVRLGVGVGFGIE